MWAARSLCDVGLCVCVMSHQVQALTLLTCTMHWGLQQLCERGEGGGSIARGGGVKMRHGRLEWGTVSACTYGWIAKLNAHMLLLLLLLQAWPPMLR